MFSNPIDVDDIEIYTKENYLHTEHKEHVISFIFADSVQVQQFTWAQACATFPASFPAI